MPLAVLLHLIHIAIHHLVDTSKDRVSLVDTCKDGLRLSYGRISLVRRAEENLRIPLKEVTMKC